jgi:hypothetical protein
MIKYILTVFIVFSSLLLLPVTASAVNDLTFDANTTISLTGSGIDLTVISGSVVDSMTVNPTSVTFALSGASSLTLRSNDKYTLSNNLNIGQACYSDYSEIIVSGDGSGSSLTVTPSTDTCTAAGTSSPAGGGGSGSTTVATTPTMPSTTTGQVTASAAAGGKTTLTTAENSTAAVEVPINAVTASTLITITAEAKTAVTASRPVPSGKSIVGGYIFNYTATADDQAVTSFSKNITLTFTYTDSQVAGFNEASLRVYYWDEDNSKWTLLTTSINTANNILTVTTDHFTYYAILGETEVVEEEEAVTVVDGDLIRNPNAEGMAQFDIYIVKIVGDKKFKRLILSPHVFESYEHLKWENVKDVSQSVMDEYTTSDLVRAEGDTKVYKLTPDGDTGTKQWLNMTVEEFETAGYDWDAIYIINTTDRDAYTTGSEIVVGSVAAEETEATTETIIIKAYALRVRSLPSLDGEILALVHQGEVYEILDEQNGWYKITTLDDITGWCFGGETGGYAEKQ